MIGHVLNDTILEWSEWMTAMLWQGTLTVVVIAAIERIGERWWAPPLRLALWWLAIVKFVLPPTWGLSYAAVPALTTTFGPVSPSAASETVIGPIPFVTGLFVTGLFVTWALGVGVALLRWGWEQRQVHALLRRSRAADPPRVRRLRELARRVGVRAPRLRISDVISSPAVVGVRRPTILLPTSALWEARSPHLDAALLHELAHLRRGDLLVDPLLRAIRCAYWFHPALWWAASRLTTLREMRCDHDVTDLVPRDAYRRTLIAHLSERVDAAHDHRAAAALGLAFTGPVRRMKRRLDRLRAPSRRATYWQNGVVSAVMVGVVVFVLPMHASLVSPSDPPETTESIARSLTSENSTAEPLEVARNNLRAWQEGEARGCLVLRYSALQLIADSETK